MSESPTHLQPGTGAHEDREPVDIWAITSVGFVRFDPATGAIDGYGRMGFAHIEEEHDRTGGILPGDGFPWSDYVDLATRSIRAKTPCPAVQDGLAVRSLPVPCRIEIATPFGQPTLYDWTEDALTLSFEHPGRYTVRVLSVPHLPGAFEVTWNG